MKVWVLRDSDRIRITGVRDLDWFRDSEMFADSDRI